MLRRPASSLKLAGAAATLRGTRSGGGWSSVSGAGGVGATLRPSRARVGWKFATGHSCVGGFSSASTRSALLEAAPAPAVGRDIAAFASPLPAPAEGGERRTLNLWLPGGLFERSDCPCSRSQSVPAG
jgi:hypothetical protein